jgi:uncharacterized membrane protein required for colicin V production
MDRRFLSVVIIVVSVVLLYKYGPQLATWLTKKLQKEA